MKTLIPRLPKLFDSGGSLRGVALVNGPNGPDGPNGQRGAPVFALTGYAAASHVIPRGFACRSLVWPGRLFTAGQSTAAMQNFAAKNLLQGYACQFSDNCGYSTTTSV